MSNRRRTNTSPGTRDVLAPPPAASRSTALMGRLSRLPRAIPPIAVLVLVLLGLLAPLPIAIPCLTIVVAVLVWLASLTWSRTDGRGKVLRGLMIGLLIGAGIARIAGGLN